MYVAGRGSAPNSAGYVELDASIMHGPSREAGAIAALPGFESPIQIARGVMEKTPHVLLAGAGAKAFARSNGFAEVADPDSYYVLPVGVTEDDISNSSAHGTVGAVALDSSGALAAATSTGGTFGKLEGRINRLRIQIRSKTRESGQQHARRSPSTWRRRGHHRSDPGYANRHSVQLRRHEASIRLDQTGTPGRHIQRPLNGQRRCVFYVGENNA